MAMKKKSARKTSGSTRATSTRKTAKTTKRAASPRSKLAGYSRRGSTYVLVFGDKKSGYSMGRGRYRTRQGLARAAQKYMR